MKVTQLIKGLLWRQIKFSKGEIKFYNAYINMIPSLVFASLLEDADNYFEEAVFQYNIAKRAYADSFFNKMRAQGMSQNQMINLTLNFVDLGGWGEVQFSQTQIKKGRAYIKLINGAIATTYKEKYGHSSYPICHVFRGAVAAGSSAIHGKLDIDAVETKCIAKGDPYCEFLVKPHEEFLKSENKEFRKQLGLK